MIWYNNLVINNLAINNLVINNLAIKIEFYFLLIKMHETLGAERATDSERGEYNYSQLENSLLVKCVI